MVALGPASPRTSVLLAELLSCSIAQIPRRPAAVPAPSRETALLTAGFYPEPQSARSSVAAG